MKFFNRGSNKINCFGNIFVSLLCTSYLFTGYYNHEINSDIHHDKAAKVIQNDMEVASQLGKKGNKVTKVTAIVNKNNVNTANKNYTPAQYNEVTGTAVVEYAKKYLGLRYVSGGNSLSTGTDCSGFTKLIYKEFGVTLSRTVKTQVNNGSYIKKSDLQKGDLVFYGYGNGVVRHVAIYIGNGKVIHESNRRDGVKISPVNMMEYITSRRVINKKANEIAQEKEENKVTNNTTNNSNNVIDSSNQTNDNINNTTNNNTTNNNSNVSSNETSKNEQNQNETTNNNTSIDTNVSDNNSSTSENVTNNENNISDGKEDVYTSGEY